MLQRPLNTHFASSLLSLLTTLGLITSFSHPAQAQAVKLGAEKVHYSRSHSIELAKLQTDREWQCSMSLFFSMDHNEQLSLNPVMEGRGLVTCKNKNDGGFQTDYPVLAEMNVEQTNELRQLLGRNPVEEFTASVNSGPFVLTRDLSDLQDRYEPHNLTSTGGSSLLLIGQHDQVAFNISVTSRNRPLRELKVKDMTLHFDNEAPDIDD